jgi:hypothetical protein
MSNEIIQLFKTLGSIGYIVLKFDCLQKIEYFYGEFELVLSPPFKLDKLLSKEVMFQLYETLASAGYGIINFDFISKDICRDIKLILYSYPKETKTS